MNTENKQCIDCKRVLPIEDFRLRKNRKYFYIQPRCKKCEAVSNRLNWYKNHEANKEKLRYKRLEQVYGLSKLDFDSLLTLQSNCCAICGCSTPTGKGTWHVDHDHITGKIRGLLCHECNTGLGLFKDSPDLLNKAKEYLIERS